MNLLIACADYPNLDGGISLNYIRTRNIYYKKLGHNVYVLNFSTNEKYCIDGIDVFGVEEFKKNKAKYDMLICHAPNLRNHYLFLLNYKKEFRNLVFFFHGHEVLKSSKVYSKPYPYLKVNRIKKTLKDLYDEFKLKIWHFYFKKHIDDFHFIFVSNWMYNEFKKWVKLDLPKEKYDITYNSIGELFETIQYDDRNSKEYDFITIRAFLDGSKYSIDIVNLLALKCPEYKFLVVGKGNFFKYNKKAPNIEWINSRLSHNKIIELLNKSRCALMPTRTDAQGLMMCEMASFGIPLITSDIPVCYEVFDTFKNVKFVNNDILDVKKFKRDYESLIEDLPYKKNDKYFAQNTVNYECQLFEKIAIKNI